jgi:predicted N-acetyltransferase YhbS
VRFLLELADDSEPALASYADKGDLLVAEEAGHPVGHVLITETDNDQVLELKSIAVKADRQGAGIGRVLVEAALAHCKVRGARRVLVATGAADVGNLRFYQRLGFRMLSIERDAFTAAHGYAENQMVDGIPLRDRVWFDRGV